MPKKIIERPWGTRRNGGWVILVKSLIASLKKGDAVQIDKVLVGTKPLINILRLLPTDYCRVTANGKLEVETVELTFRNVKGVRKAGFGKPKKFNQWFGLFDGAWVQPNMRLNPVILRPKNINGG